LTHPLLRETAAALQAGLVGFSMAGSFVSAEYQKTSWMGFALMFCLLPLARSQEPVRAFQPPVTSSPNKDDFMVEALPG
jgi:hypothetical protein